MKQLMRKCLIGHVRQLPLIHNLERIDVQCQSARFGLRTGRAGRVPAKRGTFTRIDIDPYDRLTILTGNCGIERARRNRICKSE